MQESEIAALKQNLKKQQEQTEKWVGILNSLLHITSSCCNTSECLCYVYVLFSYVQENDCMALELKYKDAVQKKEEAEKDLAKMVRLKLCSILVSSTVSMRAIAMLLLSLQLDFLQLESGLPATDPLCKDSQGKSQPAPVHPRIEQADVIQPLLTPAPEKEETVVSDHNALCITLTSTYVSDMYLCAVYSYCLCLHAY